MGSRYLPLSITFWILKIGEITCLYTMTNSISMNPIYKDSISVKRVLLTLVGGQNAPFRKCPSSLGGGHFDHHFSRYPIASQLIPCSWSFCPSWSHQDKCMTFMAWALRMRLLVWGFGLWVTLTPRSKVMTLTQGHGQRSRPWSKVKVKGHDLDPRSRSRSCQGQGHDLDPKVNIKS